MANRFLTQQEVTQAFMDSSAKTVGEMSNADALALYKSLHESFKGAVHPGMGAAIAVGLYLACKARFPQENLPPHIERKVIWAEK